MPSYSFKRILLTFFLLSICYVSYCQFYSVGQDPFSIRWKQINTDNFQVIFPEGFEEKATYISDVLEHVYLYGSESLKHDPVDVSVILHNQTVISNGFVSWAPRRIEMYTNPPQTNDVHDWLERLAVHEFRHVVQVDKLNQGMTRLLYYLFGEQAVGAVLGLYVPTWFLEGDAIATETALTHGGRGRLPSFEKGLRAQLLEKELYSFDKAVFGSYKDHVPNQYELGYQMVAAARTKFGKDVWAGVLDNVAKRPYSIIPFSRGIKNNTGLNKIQLYDSTFNFLDSAWHKQYKKTDHTSINIINKDQNLYTNYNHLHFVDEETLIALKTGLDDIPRVIKLKTDGSEEILFTPGWYLPNSFSYASDMVVWTEYQRDWRWEHRNWSVIHTYNLKTGEKQQLTNKTRFFAPAISPDKEKIAAVETTENYKFYLTILDTKTGKEKRRFSINNNDFIMTPAWNNSGDKIVFIAQNEEGKRIVEVDLTTNNVNELWHSGYTEITNPVYYNDNIIFSGAFSGIDNLYVYDRNKNEVYKILSSSYGAYEPAVSPNETQIAWSDYNSDGHQAAIINIDNLDTLKLNETKDHSVSFYKELVKQENTTVNKYNLEQSENDYDTEPYRRFPNLFNLHSWGLAYVDAANYEINPGASMMFQNMLSTSFANLGYAYDVNDETGRWKMEYSYRGFYPIIDLIAERGDRKGYKFQNGQLESFTWKDNLIGTSLRVPLSFTHYAYRYGFEPSIRKSLRHFKIENDNENTVDFQEEDKILGIRYRLAAHRYKRTVARDIRPRYGQFIDINYRHTPFGGQDIGSVFSARIISYLPGLFNHNSLKLSAAYQKRRESGTTESSFNYIFPNMINYPRSISGQFHQQLQSYSAEYAMPLLYPDLSIPYILYIKRVWANMFYDYATGTHNDRTDYFNVTGLSINSEMHIFRFFNPFTVGVRCSYNLREDQTHFDFLVNFSF